jgi:hypothetical protein
MGPCRASSCEIVKGAFATARLEACISAESNLVIVGLRMGPCSRRPSSVVDYSSPRARCCSADRLYCHKWSFPDSSRAECSRRRHCSTRSRDFREWKRTRTSPLRGEQHTHVTKRKEKHHDKQDHVGSRFSDHRIYGDRRCNLFRFGETGGVSLRAWL